MDDDPPLHDRFVLFFDFLGSSAAAKTFTRERLHQFLDLLISVAQVQSVEAIAGDALPDGGYRITVTPEVTTFSDNVVVSYQAVQEGEHKGKLEPLWTEIVCKDAIRILSSVAEMGLRIGLLIRGGLSFGQLYHEQGVVFGEAMVDAYELESKYAVHPRILVSERIIKKLTYTLPENLPFLQRDADGKWHLNYFAEMMRHAVSSGSVSADQGRRWKRAHLATIDAEIIALGGVGAEHRLEKWKWFKVQFEAATSQVQE